ncbi:malate dehydrogenase, NAD-dependent [Cryptococcus depauperatus CBS 7841]|uniref:Malate dehydrogenase n=1 Tax=Cryptococcus depauperatus CBS 7841 TaxID=1295531 RepID=A0AAJ8M3P3_9TREE
MFSRQLARQSSVLARGFASSARVDRKVAVLGAAGGIGQPLSLLLKTNPNVSGLSLYDIRGAPGVAADISHVNTESVVKGFEKDDLKEALTGAELIIIPAGVPRKPGMTRDDLFAFVGIISNPVNSTVPIFAEVLKQKGVFDEKRLFGITTLDVVRASRFLGEIKNVDPKDVKVTVVGGHSGVTIVPLLSQTSHGQDVSGEAYKALVNRIQFGGDEVVKAKAGTGSATLSMAYAGARFADSLIRALNGETGVVEPTFVKSPLYASEGVEYFASNVELGTEGVKKILSVGELTADEQELLKACLPDLAKNIKKGVDFVKA